MVENIIMKKKSLKYTLDTIIGTPRNSYEYNIWNIFPFIFTILSTPGDYEHEIILFHRNINRREKAQIHLIIITMRIMLKHARSEAQISEVALRKELEQW